MKNKTRLKQLREFVEESDDETFLTGLMEMFRRAELHHELIKLNDDTDIITHQLLYVKSGTKMFVSSPQALDYPVTMVPLPKEIVN